MIIYAILASLLALIPSLALIVWIYLQVLRLKSEVVQLRDSWDRYKTIISGCVDKYNAAEIQNTSLKAEILTVSHTCDSLHESLTSMQNKLASRSRQERAAIKAESESPQVDQNQIALFPTTSATAAPREPAPGVQLARRFIRSSAG